MTGFFPHNAPLGTAHPTHHSTSVRNEIIVYNLFHKASRPNFKLAALGLLVPAIVGLSAPALSATTRVAAVSTIDAQNVHYRFEKINNDKDVTFNQLLGIDNNGKIAGYFGSGLTVNGVFHPNKGYTVAAPYAQNDFKDENFPGSVQTQVTALNNRHDTAGFWADLAGNNFGFIEWNGTIRSFQDPLTGTGTVNQILGLNDRGIAVGFYTDGQGVNHGFALNPFLGKTGTFYPIAPPASVGGGNLTAAAINDHNDVTGFLTTPKGTVVGFLLKDNKFYEFSFPNATGTTPLGINDNDEIVGAYTDGPANNPQTHGFTLTNPLKNAHFQTVDDPAGIGATTVNGVNDKGDLVGFYVNPSSTNTDGFLATP